MTRKETIGGHVTPLRSESCSNGTPRVLVVLVPARGFGGTLIVLEMGRYRQSKGILARPDKRSGVSRRGFAATPGQLFMSEVSGFSDDIVLCCLIGLRVGLEWFDIAPEKHRYHHPLRGMVVRAPVAMRARLVCIESWSVRILSSSHASARAVLETDRSSILFPSI